MPSSVLVITSLLRSVGIMLMRSVIHIPMGKDPIIWDQIGARPMLPLTINKPRHPIQLLLIPQASPIQPRRAGSSRSRKKSEAFLGGATKSFIILVGLVFPTIITYHIRGVYVRRKDSKESIKIFNMDGSSVAHTIDSVEKSKKGALAVDRCIILYVTFPQRFWPNSIIFYYGT